jgi:hypothetical protein
MSRHQRAVKCQRCGRRTRRWAFKYINWRALRIIRDDETTPQYGWTATQAKWCFRCVRQSHTQFFRQKLKGMRAAFDMLLNGTREA